jgi:hypothetical protein
VQPVKTVASKTLKGSFDVKAAVFDESLGG